ncbi:MAG TPA: hypothetical protein VN924_07740 [Bryobacteraceae bacterium]|nr:hypothetical protein [Bryobacteraceae bacterium]
MARLVDQFETAGAKNHFRLGLLADARNLRAKEAPKNPATRAAAKVTTCFMIVSFFTMLPYSLGDTG